VRPFETELSSSAEAGVTKEGMSIFSVISFLTTTFLLVAYCALGTQCIYLLCDFFA
jgi:hypothetical protein